MNDDYTKPQLLDFGLNFHKLEEIDFHTPDWQEVGNRFLRLPELSAGSLSKQDPRSDVSFVVGILFYLLTGEHPDLLINEQGQLPHQRPNNHDLLKKSAADKYQRLASVFDTGFAYNIEERFSNASCLISRLETLTVPIPAVLTEDEQYTAIAEIFDTPQRRRLSKAKAVIELGLRKVQETISIFDAKIKNPYARSQTQFINTGEKGSNTLFWTNELNEKIISVTYEMQLSGNEITLSMSNDDVYRVMLDNPEWDIGFSEAVTNWIRNTIHQALIYPEKYLPELKLFKDVNPFTSLQLAAKEASLTGRNIIAFIYDPNKPERSQLELNLRYFLENEKTRNLMNDAFVIAIISLDIFSGFSKALENISMETASWAIFDENLSFQERDEIYGNPKEGEKIMLMLNNKYPRKKKES